MRLKPPQTTESMSYWLTALMLPVAPQPRHWLLLCSLVATIPAFYLELLSGSGSPAAAATYLIGEFEKPTLAILKQLEWARREHRTHLYLGYWIAGHPKMDYKRRFRPLEGFDLFAEAAADRRQKRQFIALAQHDATEVHRRAGRQHRARSRPVVEPACHQADRRASELCLRPQPADAGSVGGQPHRRRRLGLSGERDT